jgi:hypothetical protein
MTKALPFRSTPLGWFPGPTRKHQARLEGLAGTTPLGDLLAARKLGRKSFIRLAPNFFSLVEVIAGPLEIPLEDGGLEPGALHDRDDVPGS